MMRPPPRSPLFPYTTLFRSAPRSPAKGVTGPPALGRTPRVAVGPEAHPPFTAPRTPAYDTATCAVLTAVLLVVRSEEHTSELQSRQYLVCRLLLEKKK